MTGDKQIRRWLKDGTITSSQAKKMLADSSKIESDSKSNRFIAIVAVIGAILIFIGFAWLIANNWHQIPNAAKIFILVFAILAAFTSGVKIRQNNHLGVGRALITLGSLLYLISVFLIAQIYATPSGLQGDAWLLFLCWTVILLIAYILDSNESLVISMITFFIWVILQYLASISSLSFSSDNELIFSVILILLGAGALLFGLSILHNSLGHRFTNTYRFWTVFYFSGIFYLLCFQYLLPMISEYSFEGGAFSPFFMIFMLICFFGFIIGVFFAGRKNSSLLKEILGFVGVLVVLFILVLLTKIGAGLMGHCGEKTCYDFKSELECASAPTPLVCGWETKSSTGLSTDFCGDLRTGDARWSTAVYEICIKNNNHEENCIQNPLCKWQPTSDFFNVGRLPTNLWLLWILNNAVFIGFIILILWYGQQVGSTKIVNLALLVFILDIISRYIGFWMDFKGYFTFSVLAIFGGIMLILGAWLIPKWRKNLLENIKKQDGLYR